MNIIILTAEDKIDTNMYTISDERLTHIQKVLKSEPGDILEVGLLLGPTGNAKITALSKTSVELQIIKFNEIINPRAPKIDLICALPRPQTLKKVLNISATMGVNNIYLIKSEKVEKSYFHSPLLDKTNYNKYLIEGLSQGKRTDLPQISIHKKFKEFFTTYFNEENKNTIRLIAHPNNSSYLNKNILSNKSHSILAIGPEGGWNDYEINFMVERGFNKFKLSENILRVESAVTAALSHIELLVNSEN